MERKNLISEAIAGVVKAMNEAVKNYEDTYFFTDLVKPLKVEIDKLMKDLEDEYHIEYQGMEIDKKRGQIGLILSVGDPSGSMVRWEFIVSGDEPSGDWNIALFGPPRDMHKEGTFKTFGIEKKDAKQLARAINTMFKQGIKVTFRGQY